MGVVTRTITGTLKDANGTALANLTFRIAPLSPYGSNGVFVGTQVEEVTTDGSGVYSVNLQTLDAEGAFVSYQCTIRSDTFQFDLVAGGSTSLDELYNLGVVAGSSSAASLAELLADIEDRLSVLEAGGGSGSGSVTSAEVASQVASETSNRLSSEAVLRNAVSVVSQSLSAEAAARSAADASLSARVNSVAAMGGGGSGSVTSNELSAGLASETSNRTSAIAVIQTAVNVVSNAISTVSQALSAEIAARLAGVNTVSNAVSTVAVAVAIVSAGLAVETSNRISADTGLSNALSNEASVRSAADAEMSDRLDSAIVAGGGASTTSNAISAMIAAEASNRLSGDNELSKTISNEASARTAGLNTISNAVSVVSQALSVETAARVASINAVSNAVSVLSNANSVEHAALSARITSAAGAGGASVTSSELSTLLAGKASVSSPFFEGNVNVHGDVVIAHSTGALRLLDRSTGTAHVHLFSPDPGVLGIFSDIWGSVLLVSSTADFHVPARLASTTLDNPYSAGWNGSLRFPTENAVYDQMETLAGIVSAGIGAEASNRISADNLLSNAISNEASIRSVAVNGASNAASIVSQALSVETAARVAGVNAASNAASIVSQALSVETAARIAAVNTVSNAVSIVSNALSVEASNRISADNALSNALSNEISARNVVSNAVSTVANSLSVLSNTNSVDHAALSARITSVAGIGGTGSVTSTELSVVFAAVSVLSKDVSLQISAKAIRKAAGDFASLDHKSVIEGDEKVLFEDTGNGDIKSYATWTEIFSVMGGGGGGSVTSTEMSAAIANEVSARTSAVNVVSNAASIVSQALSVETAARIAGDNTVSNAVSIVSNAVSIVSNALSVEIANRISADNALSNSISNRISAINVVSNAVSIVSNAVSVATSNRISADNALSNAISNALSAHNTLSNTVSGYAGATITFTNKRINPRVNSVTSAPSGVLTPNVNNFDVEVIAAQGAALSIAAPTGTPVDEQKGLIRLKDSGVARSINYNAIWRNHLGTSLPSITTAGKWHRFGWIYNAADNVYEIHAYTVQP